MSSQDCTCGGCGTGTTCVYTNTPLKNDAQYTVIAYATPDILGEPTGALWVQPAETTPNDTFTFSVRDTLNEELLRDLLERVQKLEKENSILKEQVQKMNPATPNLDDWVSHFKSLLKEAFRVR